MKNLTRLFVIAVLCVVLLSIGGCKGQTNEPPPPQNDPMGYAEYFSKERVIEKSDDLSDTSAFHISRVTGKLCHTAADGTVTTLYDTPIVKVSGHMYGHHSSSDAADLPGTLPIENGGEFVQTASGTCYMIASGGDVIALDMNIATVSVLYSDPEGGLTQLEADDTICYFLKNRTDIIRLHIPSGTVSTFSVGKPVEGFRPLSNRVVFYTIMTDRFEAYVADGGSRIQEDYPFGMIERASYLYDFEADTNTPWDSYLYGRFYYEVDGVLVAGEKPANSLSPTPTPIPLGYDAYFSIERELTYDERFDSWHNRFIIDRETHYSLWMATASGENALLVEEPVYTFGILGPSRIIASSASGLYEMDFDGGNKVFFSEERGIRYVHVFNEVIFFTCQDNTALARIHRPTGRIDIVYEGTGVISSLADVTNRSATVHQLTDEYASYLDEYGRAKMEIPEDVARFEPSFTIEF